LRMHAIAYTKAANKALGKMPADYRRRIMDELKGIALDPAAYRGDWKRLSGSPFWRLRVGRYRAICDVRGGELMLLVLKVGVRGDVYK
jgi:mRNA interferase RelE/StbE